MKKSKLQKLLATLHRFVWGVIATALLGVQLAFGHSVGQIQTTKYFTPDTIQMLIDHANAGTPGLWVGDTVSYIIQFTPVANGAVTGVAGYVTDYVPAGVEVVSASIAQKDGSGNFYDVAPNLPGGIDTGWGGGMYNFGQTTFAAPFNIDTYDTTGRCTGAGAPTPTTVTYAASGNWAVPAGVTSATVEVWGGGGGGAGSGTALQGSGGGGGGGYSSSTITVTPLASIPYVVGAIGTAGAAGNNPGVAGGDSYFNNATTVMAKGGSGGTAGGAGGAGGVAASGFGTSKYSGGSGATAGASTAGGGGGGSGGTAIGGNNGAGATGATAVAGGGPGGAGCATGANCTGSAPASAPGGGGGGAYRNSAGTRAGGAGSVGRVSITYLAPAVPLYTNDCDSRLTELHADTGVFFSTDSRTSQYPSMPTRIAQGTNGYNILPQGTGVATLNSLLGQTSATTHNLWDAEQTNAFGSCSPALGTCNIAGLAAPKAAQGIINSERGATPYNTGSPVAGPQTGYQLDNTAQVGPWQRIAYSGSRMGDNTNGPATAIGSCATCVGGYSTSVGWNLSSGNPLPSGTNAIRWAVGKIVVGSINYVKVSMRITAAVPSSGLINSSEVFGGDAGDGVNGTDDGIENMWAYHVPSVADNNSNLYVNKSVVGYYSGSTLIPVSGGYIPVNAKVRYRTVYLNSGNANQTSVILSDTLPCQTAAGSISNITVISGPISATITPTNPAAGNCTTTPDTRSTVIFNNNVGVTLLPAAGGSIEYDVLTNAASGSIVTNTATLTSAAIPSPGVTANSNSLVQAAPILSISKITSTPSVAAGGTATYTITITNNGNANAGAINVYDILPSDGATADATKRFSYSATSSITGLTAVAPSTTGPAPTLTPYNSGGNSANQQQVLWNFGAQTLAPGASATITFTATVGSNVSSSATPYYNTAAVTYTGGTVLRADTANVAGVTITSPLSVTKTIESFYDTGAAAWVAYSNNIPANAKVRYKIIYANTGGTNIANANITDTLPCQIGGAGAVSNINIVSGPIALPATNPPVTIATVCPTTQAFSFTAGTLNAGQTGQIKLDVQTNAALGSTLANTATLSGTGATSVSSTVQASVTSAPLLTISKTASVTGVAQGGSLSYTITVANTGTANATGIVLYDWLPGVGALANVATRFSYASATSTTGLTAVVPTTVIPPTLAPYSTDTNAPNMQQVKWDFGAQTLAPGATFTVIYQASVGASMPIATAYYNNARVYYGTEQANAGAVGVAVGSNLSTSTKSWSDINGGDANPNDVIEYTISLKETAGIAVAGASVSDTLPATLTSPTVITCPAPATCGFAGNVLTVSNASISANSTSYIVIRGTIGAAVAAGTAIDNCAAVTNPGGVGASPCASTITVATSTIPGFGNKPLYFYDAASTPAYKVSRTKPTSGATVSIAASGGVQTWTLAPTLASSDTISNTISTSVPVQLYLSRAAAATNNITVDLYCSSAPATLITLPLATALTTTVTLYTFNLPFTGPVPSITCTAGNSWVVKVTNGSVGAVVVSPYVSATQISNVSLPSQNVINVDSVTTYSTVYPGVTIPPSITGGSTAYLRAVVSDPFGSFDIDANNNSTTQPTITIKKPDGTTMVSSAAMGTPVATDNPTAGTKIFEYAYAIPALGPAGAWAVTVNAKEGTENTVSDTGNGSIIVVLPTPSITFLKTVSVVWDPVNLLVNPKFIPGANALYTLIATNSGSGSADNNSVVINDPVPTNTLLYLKDLGGAGSGPVAFSQGATSSTLTYTFTALNNMADDLSFSNDNGATWTAVPTFDATTGCDTTVPPVTHIRINPKGTFAGNVTPPSPSFNLTFRVCVK
jgi:uncharacterized repeat protein (TIGR01451 family)